MKYLSDFERCGFKESELFPFLEKHGIRLGEAPVPPKEELAISDEVPEWKRIMALHPYLSLSEAASAFSNIDLSGSGWLCDEEEAELSRWKSLLSKAIRSEELPATETEWNGNGGPNNWASDWDINALDLAAWCASKRLNPPLPWLATLPQTDVGLRNALATCERERAEWKAKAEATSAAADQRQELLSEIGRLREELRIKTEEVAAMKAESEGLKSDTLAGKAKTTALKIIGGLAIRGWGMDIHAERLERIGEMVEDLQQAGADVTEKTLRGWIKDAANVIDPKKPL